MDKTSQFSSQADSAGEYDSGVVCLVMIARLHNIAASADQILHEFCDQGRKLNNNQLILASKKIGLKAACVNTKIDRLSSTPLPAIAKDVNGNYFILARAEQGKVLIHDPGVQRPEVISTDVLETRWDGTLLLMRAEGSSGSHSSSFDFTWFIPAIIKYRRLLGEVFAISFCLQIFSLLTPLFFQVVMDKVLVHQGLTTLDVIAVGLLGLMIFESLLSGLRSYIFSHTTSRIDVELGSNLFRHLLMLPLAYFNSRRVGDSVARVRELENIRSFLTGNSITLVLDVLFSVIFLLVMFYYSAWLSLVVILSLPLYFLISFIVTPILKSRLNDSFSKGAENQAFLVEVVNGIDTLKAMSIEPQMTRRWDSQLAAYVSAGFRTQNTSMLANECVSFVGKLVTVATLWLGARLVIDGQLSIGQLIAFNMLAGRVSQPIIRIAQLWTNFQQTGVSINRLADILNARTEHGSGARSTMPPLQGRIEFDQVAFRYRPDGSEVLRQISFTIREGEVIGVVGRSGSGKSTITKLLQRLYVPERGRVLVDGMDIALADVTSLRRQIGVVLQDSLLFSRSIRENIALADPGAPIESVIHAAKLAGAHDFILELPEGYDTEVGEHGSSLSGGQRQRIAIARALIRNPRILIFDEATSALDYESERIIQRNMASICRGRTVIIIAHRLSAVRNANKIMVIDKGQVVEEGTHQQLLQNPIGHYSLLNKIQHGGADA